MSTIDAKIDSMLNELVQIKRELAKINASVEANNKKFEDIMKYNEDCMKTIKFSIMSNDYNKNIADIGKIIAATNSSQVVKSDGTLKDKSNAEETKQEPESEPESEPEPTSIEPEPQPQPEPEQSNDNNEEMQEINTDPVKNFFIEKWNNDEKIIKTATENKSFRMVLVNIKGLNDIITKNSIDINANDFAERFYMLVKSAESGTLLDKIHQLICKQFNENNK